MKIRKCRCANAVGLKVDFLIRAWGIDDVHIGRLGKFHSFNDTNVIIPGVFISNSVIFYLPRDGIDGSYLLIVI